MLKMFFRKYPLSFFWAFIILVLTMLPGNKLPEVNIYSFDKLVHFGIFGLLMHLLLKDLKRTGALPGYIKFSFFFCFLFGTSIEIIQIFVPGRNFSVYDIIANSIGVVLGYFFFKTAEKKTNL
jgi:VanZ family protein